MATRCCSCARCARVTPYHALLGDADKFTIVGNAVRPADNCLCALVHANECATGPLLRRTSQRDRRGCEGQIVRRRCSGCSLRQSSFKMCDLKSRSGRWRCDELLTAVAKGPAVSVIRVQIHSFFIYFYISLPFAETEKRSSTSLNIRDII